MTLLTRREAAAFVRRGVRSFETRVHPHLPHYRKGRAFLYAREDLERWLEQHKVGSSFGVTESRPYVSRYKASGTQSALSSEILSRLRKSPRGSTKRPSRVA